MRRFLCAAIIFCAGEVLCTQLSPQTTQLSAKLKQLFDLYKSGSVKLNSSSSVSENELSQTANHTLGIMCFVPRTLEESAINVLDKVASLLHRKNVGSNLDYRTKVLAEIDESMAQNILNLAVGTYQLTLRGKEVSGLTRPSNINITVRKKVAQPSTANPIIITVTKVELSKQQTNPNP